MLKYKILFLTFLFLLGAKFSAAASPTFSKDGIEVQSGDVILISINCYLCMAIEAEEQAPYSHSGVVLYDPKTESWSVAQALHGVERVSIEKFLSVKKAGTKALILRHQELAALAKEDLFDGASFSSEEKFSIKLVQSFDKEFKGKPFDRYFLWDNYTAEGEELIYCSEFVAKFLNPHLTEKINPRPMHFETMRSFWQVYFKGNIPDGLPGLAPSDFARHPSFTKVGMWP